MRPEVTSEPGPLGRSPEASGEPRAAAPRTEHGHRAYRARLTRRRAALALVAAATATFAWPASAREMQQIRISGRIRIGVGLAAPWALRDPDGKLRGFEVDVARQLAADMGVAADLRVYAFDELIPALEKDEIDIIAAGLTITPQRALHINFSNPYAEGGLALATHTGNTAAVATLEKLDSDEHTIAVVADSVASELARRWLPRARLRVFDSIEDASNALVSGEVDAYLEDEPVPTFLALEHPGTVDLPLSRPLLPSPQAFAVRKGDPDFLAFLNAWITARTADTWLPTTTRYWFGSLAWRRGSGSAAR